MLVTIVLGYLLEGVEPLPRRADFIPELACLIRRLVLAFKVEMAT